MAAAATSSTDGVAGESIAVRGIGAVGGIEDGDGEKKNPRGHCKTTEKKLTLGKNYDDLLTCAFAIHGAWLGCFGSCSATRMHGITSLRSRGVACTLFKT